MTQPPATPRATNGTDDPGPQRPGTRAPREPGGEPVQLVADPLLMADPYPRYAAWRAGAPVHPARTANGLDAWLVTRHDDVRAALADPNLSLSKAHARPGGYHGFNLPPALDANLLNLDPPDHTRLRQLVAPAFTAQRVSRLRPAVRRQAQALVDDLNPRLVAHEPVDVVEDYAAPLALATIGEILGVPRQGLADFRRWTTALIAPDPAGPVSPAKAVADLAAFLDDLVGTRRTKPGDDLLSELVHLHDDDDRLSHDELVALAFLLLWAGYENSLQLTANAILALLQHPQQAATLTSHLGHPDTLETAPHALGPPAADERLPSAAVEELLRYADPNQYSIRRFPIQDADLAGVHIAAGQTVLLAIGATHRDPAIFPDADRLDLSRSPNPHLAFGAGVHHCLGAALARAHLAVAVATLLTQAPPLRLAVPAEQLVWRPSWRSRGLVALPVATREGTTP